MKLIIKPIYIFILIIAFFVFVYSPGFTEQDSVWQDSDYEKHTVETFSEYGPANEPIDLKNIDYPLLHAAIFYETNRQRIKHNLDVFKHSTALESSSFMHSKDMVEKKFFSHYNRYEKEKKTPQDRMHKFGVSFGVRGENLVDTFAVQYKAGTPIYPGDEFPPHTYIGYAESALDSWMKSPGHRRNILTKAYRYLGTGAYYHEQNSMGYFKATQNFSSHIPTGEEESQKLGLSDVNYEGMEKAQNPVWKDSYYKEFDYDRIKNYKPANEPFDFENINYALLHATIYYKLNTIRTDKGKEPFKHSTALETVAFEHSKDMVERNYFRSSNLKQRMKDNGIDDPVIYEALAGRSAIKLSGSFAPPSDDSKIFVDSDTGEIIPPHTYNSFTDELLGSMKRTMLKDKFNFIGIGAYHFTDERKNGMDKFKVTIDFAKSVPE